MNQLSFQSRLNHLGKRCATALAAVVIAACGGGGSGGGTPEATIASANINPVAGNVQDLMVTLTGANLTAGLSVTSSQCTTLTRSTTAPNASDANTAYYRCTTTATAPSTVTVTAARSSDGSALATASFTLGAATTVTQALAGDGAVAEIPPMQPAVAGKAKYSQLLTVTVTGTNVNQGLNVQSGGCSGMALSTSPPLISSASTAYYRCKVTAFAGLDQVIVSPMHDNSITLAAAQFFAPQPQVTLAIKLGESTTAIPLGSFVITLAPSETPLTVNNFLGYVNAGFYDGTIFDLIVKTPTPTLMLGGSYSPTTGVERPPPKATNAPIALEVSRGLSNVQWTVGMDHSSGRPDSATSGFYINMVDNPQLDPDAATGSNGFAVFGNIAADPSAGRAVLSQMANSTCSLVVGFSECLAVPNVTIESAVQTR